MSPFFKCLSNYKNQNLISVDGKYPHIWFIKSWFLDVFVAIPHDTLILRVNFNARDKQGKSSRSNNGENMLNFLKFEGTSVINWIRNSTSSVSTLVSFTRTRHYQPCSAGTEYSQAFDSYTNPRELGLHNCSFINKRERNSMPFCLFVILKYP